MPVGITFATGLLYTRGWILAALIISSPVGIDLSSASALSYSSLRALVLFISVCSLGGSVSTGDGVGLVAGTVAFLAGFTAGDFCAADGAGVGLVAGVRICSRISIISLISWSCSWMASCCCPLLPRCSIASSSCLHSVSVLVIAFRSNAARAACVRLDRTSLPLSPQAGVILLLINGIAIIMQSKLFDISIIKCGKNLPSFTILTSPLSFVAKLQY